MSIKNLAKKTENVGEEVPRAMNTTDVYGGIPTCTMTETDFIFNTFKSLAIDKIQ